MGIPSAWIPVLSMNGFNSLGIQRSKCQNIIAGAWIIAFEKNWISYEKIVRRWRQGTMPLPMKIKAKNWMPLIQQASRYTGVPVALIEAVITQESGFNPSAISSAGAIGLMQLMPSTAARLGVKNPLDAQQNVFGGAVLLRRLLLRFGGNLELALAAYNSGTANVLEFGGIPPFAETRAYVPDVVALYHRYGGQTGGR